MAEDWIKVADDFMGLTRVDKITSHQGELYGVSKPFASQSTLLKWDNVSSWVEVIGATLGGSLRFLDSIDGELYHLINGDLYRFDGVSSWVFDIDGGPGFGIDLNSRGVIKRGNSLFTGRDSLLESSLGASFVEVAPAAVGPTSPQYNKLLLYNNYIYAGTNSGELLEWNDVNQWSEVAGFNVSEDIVIDMVVFDDAIYALYENRGELLKWDDFSSWILMNPTDVNRNSFSLTVFDGNIYRGSGVAGGSSLWKFNFGTGVFDLVNNPSVDLISILSLEVHNNKIYGSGV